jgi:hypothetical protein
MRLRHALRAARRRATRGAAPVMADSTRAAFWPLSSRRAALDVRKCVYRPACISVMRQQTTSTTCPDSARERRSVRARCAHPSGGLWIKLHTPLVFCVGCCAVVLCSADVLIAHTLHCRLTV